MLKINSYSYTNTIAIPITWRDGIYFIKQLATYRIKPIMIYQILFYYSRLYS